MTWFVPTRGGGPKKVRLVCLAYAGGAATLFRGWADHLPDADVRAVQLPGRQDRIVDAPFVRIDDIAAGLAEALGALSELPLAIYGHSFGALVGYELARRLLDLGRAPRALIAGASVPPQLRSTVPNVNLGDEQAIMRVLRERYGADLTLLETESEIRELGMISLRADFEALQTYVHHRPEQRLACDVTVLRGLRDTSMTADDARAWEHVTTGRFAVHELDAGHFFIDTHAPWLLERVRQALGG